MATNLAIKDELIREAVAVGGHKTKKEAVTCALEAYIQHMKQLQIIDHFGNIDFDEEYDYKAHRNR